MFTLPLQLQLKFCHFFLLLFSHIELMLFILFHKRAQFKIKLMVTYNTEVTCPVTLTHRWPELGCSERSHQGPCTTEARSAATKPTS